MSERKTKRLVFGVGTNDADYVVGPRSDGGTCPFYHRWKGMLQRCYSKNPKAHNFSYRECSVCDEWLTFSNFKTWMEKQDWKGKDLDKDIILPGNKIYSPENCCFVSVGLNSLFVIKVADRGNYPTGVIWDKRKGKFRADICAMKKTCHLGYFDTPSDASKAYQKQRSKLLFTWAKGISDLRVSDGILRHARRALTIAKEITPNASTANEDSAETGAEGLGVWQPIETAPKDDVVDLLVDGKTVTDCFRVENGWVTDNNDDWVKGNITHWMPLPAAPSTEREVCDDMQLL